MNKFRTLLSVVLAVVILASCADDDLENRLDKVEGALGTDEPLKTNFSTKDANDVDIINKRSYLFKYTGNDEAIYDYGDGTYYVYIERFSDVEWAEGAWIEFYYNSETNEVTGRAAGTYFYNQFANWESARFDDDYDANTIDIVVNSFSAETGKISVNVTASSEAAYGQNIHEGKPMNMTLSFRGKLRMFQSND
jgi:hypothetical protein